MTISKKCQIPDIAYRKEKSSGHTKRRPVKKSPLLALYWRISSIVAVYLFFKLLGFCGLITWRTERDGHWAYLMHTAKESLDNNTVLEGAKSIGQEFIFDLFNLGGWIKYLLAVAVVIAVIRVFPFVVIRTYKFLCRHEQGIRAVFSCSKKAMSSFSAQRMVLSVENFIKYGIILPPDDTVKISRSVGISINIGGKEYFGGIVADCAKKVNAVSMIARDGTEIIHVFSYPVSVIPGRKRVYLCGNLTDANGSAQKRIELSTFSETVMIGSECYSINISSL